MLPIDKVNAAVFEAIFWWNRTEGYYHKYFSRIDELHSDKELFQFFVKKIFEVFLNDYSVRRNIASGPESVYEFANQLVKSEYFRRVKAGDQSVVDDTSHYLRSNSSLVNRKHTRSLLSKTAFLINPSHFSLIDNYARRSLWSLVNNQKRLAQRELENYSNFVKEADIFLSDKESAFQHIYSYLDRFPNSRAKSDFKNSPCAFRRRVFDKFLWINIADQEGVQIINTSYPSFYGFADNSLIRWSN